MRRDKGEELYVSVPSFFRCPISMDVMKSPVSLCTGVTYDRSSIQTWLSQGHNTCPATMQVLPSNDFTPNLTLRRLINLWLHHQQQFASSPTSPSSVVAQQQALDIIKKLAAGESCKSSDISSSLQKIIDFVNFSDENRKFVASSGDAVASFIKVFHNSDEIEVFELIFNILDSILSEAGVKDRLSRSIANSDRDQLSKFLLILQGGKLSSKIQSVRILESLALNAETQSKIVQDQGLLHELFRFTSSETDDSALEAGLSALIAVSTSRLVRKELVRFGIVRTVVKLLSGPETSQTVVEKALRILETVARCTEGRTAIAEDADCVVEVVKKLKCSGAATEHGIMVLWSVCYLARDRTAKENVVKVNGLTKVLLVMQSNCSAGVRQMCGDLVKVLRVKSKSCLASYDTRTTHIMPY